MTGPPHAGHLWVPETFQVSRPWAQSEPVAFAEQAAVAGQPELVDVAGRRRDGDQHVLAEPSPPRVGVAGLTGRAQRRPERDGAGAADPGHPAQVDQDGGAGLQRRLVGHGHRRSGTR